MATTLVNCTNSYDVKEVIPELVQLAKFSKQHVPEEHPKVRIGMTLESLCHPAVREVEQNDSDVWVLCVCVLGRIWHRTQIN